MKINSFILGLIIICFFVLNIKTATCQKRKFHLFKHRNEKFDTFYTKFLTDTVFQLKRIAFPIHGRYMSDEIARTQKNDTKIYTKTNWNILHPLTEKDLKNFTSTREIKDDTVIVKIKGIVENFLFEETYTKKRRKWFLVNLTDLSM